MFNVATAIVDFRVFLSDISVGVAVVVITTLAVAGALMIVAFGFDKVKRYGTGKKW